MEKMGKLIAPSHNRSHTMIISFIFYVIVGENGALFNKIDVMINDMVSIHCYTNAPLMDIQWHFNSIFNPIYAGRRFYQHKDRFRMEKDDAGTYILIIPKVRSEDAGWYYCVEEISGRRISSTDLTVLYSDPVCYSNMHPKGFIGPNTCNLEQEIMVFNCVVSFNGTSPHLIWRVFNDNRTLNSSTCEDKPNRRNCSLNLKSDPIFDGSIFICQTTASIDSSFNCSIEAIKILYFSSTSDTAKKYMHLNDNLNCSANSNLNVEYNWTLKQSNKVAVLSSNQNLVIQMSGIYHCEVNYDIRNYSCITLASVVNVSVENTEAGTISGSATLAIILPIVLVVFFILSIGMFVLMCKRRKRKRENKVIENELTEKVNRVDKTRENEITENKRIRSKIEDMQTYFVSNVDPQDVLEPLIHDVVISKEDRDIVLNKTTREDSCRALLGHISSSSHPTSFIVLKNALDIYYPWIADQISAKDDIRVTTLPKNERIKDKVISMYLDFTSEVDPKNVFDLLIRNKIVNLEEKRKIMNTDTTVERCRALIDHLFFCSKENAFIILREALKELYPKIVERIDASNIENETKDITTTGEGKQENERIRNRVVAIYEDFVSEVDPKKVLDFLIQNKIVNLKQRYYLDNEVTTEKQCEALLDLLFSCSKDNMFIIFKEALKELYPGIVERIDSPTTDDEVVNNPNRRTAVRLESSVVVFGEVDAFKINLNRPDEVSALQRFPIEAGTNSSSVAAAIYCGSVFVCGIGKDNGEIWRFDARYSKWNKCASMTKGRFSHSVAFVDHISYICGGRGIYSIDPLDDVEAYNVIDDKCSAVGKLTYAVNCAGNCVPYKASLYIFGGRYAKSENENRVQVYNTKLNSCTILTNHMPRKKAYLRAALLTNRVILLGEESCFLYNFDAETWEVRDQFKTGVEGFGMTVHNEKLFVIGGRDSNGIHRDDVRYVPIVNILNGEPIEWKHHAKLTKPFAVHAIGKFEFLVKQI